MIYPETIVRLRAPLVVDRYNKSVPDWPNAVETTFTDVQVQPSSATEPVEVGRTAAITHMRLLTPIGTDLDLLRTDRVRWSDEVWQVDGEVARHMRPSDGAVHHVEAMLKRVAG
jgi:hypothetical protein